MAASILTATTPEQLAEQFPHTLRPFAVLYNDDPGCDSRKWAVNNESGETTQEFEDMATALKAAAEMGSEWDAEARKQAQALAEVIELNNANSTKFDPSFFNPLIEANHQDTITGENDNSAVISNAWGMSLILDMRASIFWPISSLSWKAKT